MINFLHTFNPDPILISLGPINIYWYGFFILLGSISALLITLKLASYYNIKKDTIINLAFYLIIGGIIGARIYHVFLEFPYYLSHPLNIFKIWQGGLAIHGGIIAGVIILFFFAKSISKRSNLQKGDWISARKNFWLLSAILVPGLALAQAIGRWGNYFNQELFGLPTDKAWGIPINFLNRPAEFLNFQYFHPTFIYESMGNFLIFLILILINVWIIKNHKNPNSYKLTAISYLILYSILRFSLEFIRIDTTPELLGLRFPQIVSLLIIFLTPIIILLLPKNKKNVSIK